MIIESVTVEAFEIRDADRLDPVLVILRQYRPGAGSITLSCWGTAWTASFGSMGTPELRAFLVSCDPDYLLGKFTSADRRMSHAARRHEEAYLRRIVAATLEALCMPRVGTAKLESSHAPG